MRLEMQILNALSDNRKDIIEECLGLYFDAIGQTFLNWILIWASRKNHIGIIDFILSKSNHALYDAVAAACYNGNLEIVEMMLKDWRFDPIQVKPSIISIVTRSCNLNILELLLQDRRADPNKEFAVDFPFHGCKTLKPIHGAFVQCRYSHKPQNADANYWAIVDRLLLDTRVDSMATDMPNFFDVRMIRFRSAQVCIGLQDLSLPALVTLEILDALIPNSIPMYAKWNLIVAVKHFHDKPQQTLKNEPF